MGEKRDEKPIPVSEAAVHLGVSEFDVIRVASEQGCPSFSFGGELCVKWGFRFYASAESPRLELVQAPESR